MAEPVSVPTYNPANLRIGMFSESFHPVQNGVTTSVLTLVSGLRMRGHHVCVFAPAHEQQPDSESHVLRFPSFVSVFNRDYPLAYPFLPRLALATHFDRLRLDVVHTHTPFVLGLTGAKLALQRGVPLVSTFHTLYTQYAHYMPFLPDTVTQSLLERYLPWYYNRCAEIICPSEVAAQALRANGIERPIQVIPTGIPLPSPSLLTDEARCLTRARIGVAHDTPLLVYAGRIAREKNLDLLLEVLGTVIQTFPAVRLAIVGGGPYAEEFHTLAAPLSDNILFLGPTPHDQITALLAAADVFCFPSPSETQGLVIGEARAAGTPCVVVDAGGAPETVRNGKDGFRIPLDAKGLFAARVTQILGDAGLRATMRRNALRNAQQYTPERMVDSVLAVYRRARLQQPVPSDIIPSDLTSALRVKMGDDVEWETVDAPDQPVAS